MKVLSVIKWIAFVVCILCFAVCAVGNVFVALDVKDNADIKVEDVKASLEQLSPLKDIFGGSKKVEQDTPDVIDNAEAGDIVPGDSSTPTDDMTDDWSQPVVPDTGDDIVDDIADDVQTPIDDMGDVSTPTDDIQDVPQTVVSAALAKYTPDHNNVVVAFMKYGKATTSVNFLSKTLKLSGINPFAKCLDNFVNANKETDKTSLLTSYEFTDSPLGLQDNVNTSLFIAYIALFIAFILQVITKSNKTFYGTLLTVIGYLFFAVLFAAGYYLSDCIVWMVNESITYYDWHLLRAYFMAFILAFSLLIGVPIYSCGVRQMKINYLKHRPRKKRHQ